MSKKRGLLHGRFTSGVHPALDRVNRSWDVDRRMWAEDIEGSRAHAVMLGEQGILSAAAVKKILRGLKQVEQELRDGSFEPKPVDEDLHMAIERRLIELIGDHAKRLHVARSRNDQVATDLLLYLHHAAARLRAQVRRLQAALVAQAEAHGEAVLPFYTHLQRAQPILLGHVLLAYVEMLERESTSAARRMSRSSCARRRSAGGTRASSGTATVGGWRTWVRSTARRWAAGA